MNKYTPQVGETCQFLYKEAIKPTWNNCLVKAISDYGYAIEVDSADFGLNTTWWDNKSKGNDLIFRPIIEYSRLWRSENGDVVEMVCLANKQSAEHPITAVYKYVDSDEALCLPADEFMKMFSVYSDVSGETVFDECPIIESQNAPVEVQP